MKTLQIGLEWFPEAGGGLDRVYYDCSHYLPQVGIDFRGLVVGSSKVIKTSDGRVEAVAEEDASLLKRWRGVRAKVRQLVSEEEFDLVVSHFALYTFPVLELTKHLPLVFHFHGPWASESGVEVKRSLIVQYKRIIEYLCYRRASQFIVLSETFRDLLHHEYQVPLNLINIVPGGVNVDRFGTNLTISEARQQLNWHLERPIIFCIRRLTRRMGLENLIAAMTKVVARYPNALLYIAGKGMLATELQAQIKALELTNNVKLLGYVSEEQLALCYRAANFSVVPTIALEGFGLIVIESLASGTPVLGTPVGGIPEILKPFAEDLVFEGHQPEEIAKGIIEALSGARTLPDSQTCIDYVRANYDWDATAQKIKLVYQKALNYKHPNA